LQDPKRSAPMKEHFDTIAHLRSCKPSTPPDRRVGKPVPTSFTLRPDGIMGAKLRHNRDGWWVSRRRQVSRDEYAFLSFSQENRVTAVRA
jgi:hypothetical protein